MKADVGILSFYKADNYGAVLQCYALQKYIRIKGHEVKLIRYNPLKMYSLKYIIRRQLLKGQIEHKFDQFRKDHFMLARKNDSFHTVIVGSDQVWNSRINHNDTFWIDPGVKRDRIYAYAASIGVSCDENNTYLNQGKKLFEKYSLISVREENAQSILESYGLNSMLVCDPTLLFFPSMEVYDELSKCSTYNSDQNYILVYSLEYSDSLDELISELKAKNSELLFIGIHPMNSNLQKVDRFLRDAGPCDFLKLIKNASAVITNSYHGLIFASIFKKNTWVIRHSSLFSRQTSFIANGGLNFEEIDNNVLYVDGHQNYDKMIQWIEFSKNTLDSMLDA